MSEYQVKAMNIAATIDGVSTPVLHCNQGFCGLTLGYNNQQAV